MASLGHCHQGELAIRSSSVIAAHIETILSRVNIVDLSVQRIEILSVEIYSLCNPWLNSGWAVSVVPLTSIDQDIRALAISLVVIPGHVINHAISIESCSNTGAGWFKNWYLRALIDMNGLKDRWKLLRVVKVVLIRLFESSCKIVVVKDPCIFVKDATSHLQDIVKRLGAIVSRD